MSNTKTASQEFLEKALEYANNTLVVISILEAQQYRALSLDEANQWVSSASKGLRQTELGAQRLRDDMIYAIGQLASLT